LTITAAMRPSKSLHLSLPVWYMQCSACAEFPILRTRLKSHRQIQQNSYLHLAPANASTNMFLDAEYLVELTCHVVAPIILLDVVHTVAARTLLREFADGLKTCGFLRLLIALLAARCTILIVLACFAFMPVVLVEDTHLVATRDTCEDVAFHAAHMNLARVARSTPSKVGCTVTLTCWCSWGVQRHQNLRSSLMAARAMNVSYCRKISGAAIC
jgi:hypothetical protein